MLNCQQYIARVRQTVQEIDADSVNTGRERFDVIIDVREAEETAHGTLPGAICIPRGVLEMQLERLMPKNTGEAFSHWLDKQTLLVYCRTGGRSALAAASLKAMGLSRVYSLAGGVSEWQNKGYALTTHQ